MNFKDKLVWSLWDFATTPIAFVVNSIFLPLLILQVTGSNTLVAIIPIITAVVTAFWTPVVGTLIDKSENQGSIRRRIIFISAIIAAFSIYTLPLFSNAIYIVLTYSIASIAIQTGWTACNSYLAVAVEETKVGSVSGFGIAMGYLGGGIGTIGAAIVSLKSGNAAAFQFIAIFFLIFALIPALGLKDTEPAHVTEHTIFSELIDTINDFRKDPDIFKFLIASIAWGDGVSAIMTYASIIVTQVMGVPENEVSLFLIFALPAALFGSILLGKISDKIGLVITQAFILLLWISGVGYIIFWGTSVSVILAALIAGFALGGSLAVTRGLYCALIPEGKEGKFMGVSAIFGLFGGILGPFLTGVIADLPGMSIREGLLVPLISFAIGLLLLITIREPTKDEKTYLINESN